MSKNSHRAGTAKRGAPLIYRAGADRIFLTASFAAPLRQAVSSIMFMFRILIHYTSSTQTKEQTAFLCVFLYYIKQETFTLRIQNPCTALRIQLDFRNNPSLVNLFIWSIMTTKYQSKKKIERLEFPAYPRVQKYIFNKNGFLGKPTKMLFLGYSPAPRLNP